MKYEMFSEHEDRNGKTVTLIDEKGKKVHVEPDGSVGYYIKNPFGNKGCYKHKWVTSEKRLTEIRSFLDSIGWKPTARI